MSFFGLFRFFFFSLLLFSLFFILFFSFFFNTVLVFLFSFCFCKSGYFMFLMVKNKGDNILQGQTAKSPPPASRLGSALQTTVCLCFFGLTRRSVNSVELGENRKIPKKNGGRLVKKW